MGLPVDDARMVVFLVAHHVTMSHIAQRRDIDDPKTIADFAAIVGDPERLRTLYLLTYADMRAVGPRVLTGWQAVVLHDLYTRTLTRLTGGRVAKPNRLTLVPRVHALLGPDVPLQAVKAHLAMTSDRYLATTSPQRMAEHLRLVQMLDRSRVATELFHHPDLGSSDLVVVTQDISGLFSVIAGTLAAHGLNIISAQIHTRQDGIAIDTLQVNDPTGEAATGSWQWERMLASLRAVLAGEQSVEELLERRRRSGRSSGTAAGRPKILVDNHLSDDYTVVEVKCPDRVGLLYLITRTLSSLGLDIASARIATEIDQALDTFYVHDGRGGKLDEPLGTARAAEALEQALVEPL
jgi:[protein-PII] uridylyltransferase